MSDQQATVTAKQAAMNAAAALVNTGIGMGGR